MTRPLMTKAICWELAVPVAPDFARRNNRHYYFCPHANCLQRVHGTRLDNAFFRAEKGHADNCPNAKPRTGISPIPQPARSYPRADPPQLIPTWLGPLQRVNRALPSAEQRQTLAVQLAGNAPVVPGSLRDVITAFHWMSFDQRRDTTLTVDGCGGCYADAFHKVAVSEPVALDLVIAPGPIFFCGATVKLSNNVWWIRSLKRFEGEGFSLPLLCRIPKDCSDAKPLQDLDDQRIDLYWRGIDRPRRTENSFLARFFEFEQKGFVALKAR